LVAGIGTALNIVVSLPCTFCSLFTVSKVGLQIALQLTRGDYWRCLTQGGAIIENKWCVQTLTEGYRDNILNYEKQEVEMA
jgi:hypothetical protein